MQQFTYDELETITGCKKTVLMIYVSMLLRAGYVKKIGKVEGNGLKKIYRLVKDTGPKPLRARVGLYDPNTKEFH
jgi:hypothetical protein